jgi:DEAD/DEAH box helicase domain-containing protein
MTAVVSPAPGEQAEDAAAPAAAAAFRMLGEAAVTGRLTHLEELPARPGREAGWPQWAPLPLIAALAATGVRRPWAHQAAAAELARAGSSVIVSTGTASGKSLAYLLPGLTAIFEGGTVAYIAPTKALAADQFRMLQALGLRRLRAAVIDGDTPPAERAWARAHANYLLTTPDMLHTTLLPGHVRMRGFFQRLRYVVVDECHCYRGVFGSHVAQVLRRLRRIAAHHQARAQPGGPRFILASATVSDPAAFTRLLTGLETCAVTDDAAPRGTLTIGLWEPPLTGLHGEVDAPLRRTAAAEAATMLAELVGAGSRALAFVRSRRAAESVALTARRRLADSGQAQLAGRVAAYRSGYLAEDRREIEAGLQSGQIRGLAATNALELGVNISGLDVVLMAGWPGSRAAFWQQAGRAGRGDGKATAMLIARDDPLDTYLVHHPESLLRQPVETVVLDPANPYVLAPHICAAAAELPLSDGDLEMFGPAGREVAEALCREGMLRRRESTWHLTRNGGSASTSLRGAGGAPVRIVEARTGRLVGTVDEPSSHLLVHAGAVYPHQGEMYLVETLDLAERVALVQHGDPGYSTSAREQVAIALRRELASLRLGEAKVCFGEVEVTRQVTSFIRRRSDTSELIGQVPLDLPPRMLVTRAVWWAISARQRARLAAAGVDLPGAAHAVEHAAIGLLPLVAACDRFDVGGVSADLHPATGRLTVFVYDGYQGGAGFAERGYAAARDWLRATAEVITCCECLAGCPSCIQSPRCGDGNQPLSKPGALAVLSMLLDGAGECRDPARPRHRKPA